MNKLLLGTLLATSLSANATPMWTFTPLTPTKFTIQANQTVNVRYMVTSQATKTKTLTVNPILGIYQDTTSGNCSSPFVLNPGQSCVLSLNVLGSQVTNVNSGPTVCQTQFQCYEPSAANALTITKR